VHRRVRQTRQEIARNRVIVKAALFPSLFIPDSFITFALMETQFAIATRARNYERCIAAPDIVDLLSSISTPMVLTSSLLSSCTFFLLFFYLFYFVGTSEAGEEIPIGELRLM